MGQKWLGGMANKVYFGRVGDGKNLGGISQVVKKVFREARLLDLVESEDFLGIKLHFGEEDNLGFVKPEWVKALIDELKPKTQNIFLTDTNTLYRGKRADSIDHLKLASLHGFKLATLGVPVIIADGLLGRAYEEIPVEGKHLRSVKIAKLFRSTDFILALSHLTGHMVAGFGGALKNLGMGCASRAGKLEQHSTVSPKLTIKKCTGCGLCLKHCPAEAITIVNGKARISKEVCIGCAECIAVCSQDAIQISWNESTKNLQEKMVEYACGATNAVDGCCGFMNFLIKVTKDCDCMAKDDPAIVPDIGILASRDPVAIDKASCDLINEAGGKDKFREGYPEIDWQIQLEYAHQMGMGSLEYELVEVK